MNVEETQTHIFNGVQSIANVPLPQVCTPIKQKDTSSYDYYE